MFIYLVAMEYTSGDYNQIEYFIKLAEQHSIHRKDS